MDKNFVKKFQGQWVNLAPEQETRHQFAAMARTLGCYPEYCEIMKKYDDILKRCGSKQERDAIATMGILEIEKLFDGSSSVGQGGTLTQNGKIILTG
jgi:hypothetical protein